MRPFRDRPIKQKLLLVFMLTSLAALLLASAGIIAYEVIGFRRTILQALTGRAHLIGSNSTAALRFNNVKDAEDILATLKADTNMISACIYGSDGRLFAMYLREGEQADFPPQPGPHGHAFSSDRLVMVQPISLSGKIIGTIYLEQDLQEMYTNLKVFLAIVGTIIFCAAVLAFVLSTVFQRVISEPILELSTAARAISEQKNYSIRAVKRGQDELGVLIDGFNEMLSQIQRREKELRKSYNELIGEIEERRRAEKELRESEEQFRAMFELAAVGKAQAEPGTGRFLRVNHKLCEITGYTSTELLGMTTRDITYSDDREPTWERFQSCVRGEIPEWSHEKRYLRKDGSIIWVMVNGTILRDAEGRSLRSTADIQDITERKQAVDALRANEARLRLFVEHAPAAIAMFDRQMRYILASHRWYSDYHLGDQSIIGHNHYDVFPEIPERWKEVHRRGLAGEVITKEEDTFQRADGTTDWLRWGVYPWRDDRGEIGGIIVFSELITARKEAERLIKESEERLRLAIDSAKLGVWELDFATNQVLRGGHHDEIFGLDPKTKKWTSEKFFQCMHPDDCERVKQAVATAVQQKNLYHAEFRLVRPHGEIRWLVASGRASYDAAGKPVSMIGTVRDITERKAAEEEILHLNLQLEQRVRQRTAELETVNKELEAFSYSVSHDLRAPLRSMHGFAIALEEDCDAQLGDIGKEHIQRILNSVKRMEDLVEGLLGLARISRTELRLQTVDLTAQAREITAELRQNAPDRDVKFVIAPNLKVNGDPSLLRLVLQNLLENAWKFTSKCPHPKIEFGEMKKDGKQVFFVRDDGAGFDMAYANKLFGTFQRLHATTEFTGTGIGLATVQRIIHRHGGKIWAEGAVDKGATFYFTL